MHFGQLKTAGGYFNSEVTSAMQKCIRRGLEEEALFWIRLLVDRNRTAQMPSGEKGRKPRLWYREAHFLQSGLRGRIYRIAPISRNFQRNPSEFLFTSDCMAERVGFEPTLPFRVNTLSKRAPSATRPSLRSPC
jgi:hypothetical protein